MGNIVVKVVIQGILLTEVLPILLEAEREDMDLPMAPREQRGEVGAEEEGVGAGEVDVPPASRMDAVDGLLEIRAELYLVDEQAIGNPSLRDSTTFLCSAWYSSRSSLSKSSRSM